MKTIVLIRHSKSSWKFPELKDADRPLNKRGVLDAPMMANVLKNLEMVPDLMISSPAERAMATAKLMAKELNYPEDGILVEPKLYLESKSKLQKVISSIDDRFNTVFFISHNPGLTELANALTDASVENIPTSGAFGIQFECNSWSEIEKGKGKNTFFEIAKKYRKKIEKSTEPVL